MKKIIAFFTSCVAILAFVTVAFPTTLSTAGFGGYDYDWNGMIYQGGGNWWAEGQIDFSGFLGAGVNDIWFELGMITDLQKDRALVTYGVPSYMFNNAAGLLFWKTAANSFSIAPFDYAGDFPGGVGTAFTFTPTAGNYILDYKLTLAGTPSSGGTINLWAGYGASSLTSSLAVGTDNWNKYGWSFPTEDFTTGRGLAQMYSWGGAGSIDYTVIPEPGSLFLLGSGLLGLGIVSKIRRKKK